MGYHCFSGYSGLTTIDIPSGVTRINDGIFAGCSSLTTIDIPSSVTRIDGGAFAGCSGLTTITIKSYDYFIEEYAFRDCPLKEIYVLATIPQYAKSAFISCYDATLHVPIGYAEVYRENSEWGQFKNIVEFEVWNTGITQPNTRKFEVEIFNLQGLRMKVLTRGLYIHNGKIKIGYR